MDFEVIASGYQFVEAPRVDTLGRVWFSDLLGKGLYRTTPGGRTEGFLLDRPWMGASRWPRTAASCAVAAAG